ncbi:MAG TPA: hypothetical protein VED46_06475 [Alphaproteobacteria bacterium]|nr:hypothetical protein [Alphaproteobacteria bacterium]
MVVSYVRRLDSMDRRSPATTPVLRRNIFAATSGALPLHSPRERIAAAGGGVAAACRVAGAAEADAAGEDRRRGIRHHRLRVRRVAMSGNRIIQYDNTRTICVDRILSAGELHTARGVQILARDPRHGGL